MQKGAGDLVSFFLRLTIACLFSVIATKIFAAEVKEISQQRRIVNINKGKVDGFVKNEEVCFYEVSGKLVGCGKVKRAKLYSASIKVSSEIIKKILPSQTVRLKKQAEAAGLIAPTFAFRFVLSPTLVSHVKFNQLSYVTPVAETANSLWQSGETIKSAPLTFALEGDLMRYRIAFGVRGRTFRTLASQGDYNVLLDEYITMQAKASAFGAYFDVAAFKTTSKTERQFTLALGIDYDVSTVDVTGTKQVYDTDDKEDIYKIKSTLATTAVRIVSKLDWIFSSSILGVGLNILIPVSSSQDFSVNSKDDANRSKLEDPDTDLKQKLNHTTNSLGIDAVLSYAIPF
jgi:hypothetical protein